MQTRITAAMMALVLALACPLIGASSAQAQAARQELDRDAQELKQYRLTMPKVKQMAAATMAFAREIESDPAMRASKQLDREIEALESKGSLTDPQQKQLDALRAKREAMDRSDAAKDDGDDEDPKTLADMSRRIEKEPRLAAAIKNAGLTPREYSLITLSFFQAMFVHMMQKTSGKELPPNQAISVDNLRFVQQNEAELQQIFGELQAQDKN